MAFPRSLLFAFFSIRSACCGVLAAFPASRSASRALRGVTHIWVKLHRWGARFLLGIATRSKARPRGPALVAAKHQSMYETIELVLLLHEPQLS